MLGEGKSVLTERRRIARKGAPRTARLHVKVGFRKQGVQCRMVFANDQMYDQILYGLLKEENERMLG